MPADLQCRQHELIAARLRYRIAIAKRRVELATGRIRIAGPRRSHHAEVSAALRYWKNTDGVIESARWRPTPRAAILAVAALAFVSAHLLESQFTRST